MATTITTLVVNALFKFAVPALTGFTFSRTGEMVFGCALPIIMLAAFEIYFVLTGKTSNRMPNIPHGNKPTTPSATP